MDMFVVFAHDGMGTGGKTRGPSGAAQGGLRDGRTRSEHRWGGHGRSGSGRDHDRGLVR